MGGGPLSQQEINKRNAMFENGQHWCTKCEQFKTLENFAKCKGTTFGYYFWCKDCHSKRRRGNRRILDKMNKRNRQLVDHFTKLSGGKCQRCGYCRANAALDFHHVNPNEKDETPMVAILSGNMERATREIDKCALLCSNCHREHWSGYWRCEFIKREGLGWTIKRGSIIESSFDEIGELPEKYLFTQLGLNL